MSVPTVDLIIPVHDPRRPINRAVSSVLHGTRTDVRVSVIVHNTPRGPIDTALAEWSCDARLRIVEHQDGIRSPSGPFNAGLDLATADYTSVLGSDDTLEAGAIDSWLALAKSASADVVIARLRYATGPAVPTPPTRPARTRSLDGVRDRLCYRSAPLGLVSRKAFGALRFAVDRAVGEDVPYVTRLWLTGARTAYDRRGPAYLLHRDVEGRTTVTRRPIAAELSYFDDILGEAWFTSLPSASRTAFGVKAMRIHVFGAITNRDDPALWTAEERADLRVRAQALLASAPHLVDVLSRRDRALLDAVLDLDLPAAVLLDRAAGRRTHAAPGALFPRQLRHALRREAPLRLAAASVLQLR